MPTAAREVRLMSARARTITQRAPERLCPVLEVVEVTLHPSTEPAVIAATQRADVARCVADRREWADDPLDIDAISDAVVLSLWVVWRRLGELGYDLDMPAPKRVPGKARGAEHHMRLPGGN